MLILRPIRLISHSISEFPIFSLRNKMSLPSKVARLNSYIGTHDGTFHCDDVTACFMLKQLDRFKEHEIVRTRDMEKLAKAEIVVDVGSELDVKNLRLDHHQRSFNQTIKDYHPDIKTTNPNKPVRLSSSGLVFAIFGKDLIVKLLNLKGSYYELDKDCKKMIDAIFEKAYTEFFEEIDAIDNGVEVASGNDLVYNYHISSGISSRVGRLNPVGKDATPEQRLDQFKKAMDLVGKEISEGIKFLGQVWWPIRKQFREFVMKREQFDPSGQIVHIEGDYLISWRSALLELEEELNIIGHLKYIVYNDESDVSPWRAIAVPIDLKSFALRAPLKEEWRGKRDDDLQKVSGIPDATFVHMNGFTGGAKSLTGIKSMVRQTLGLDSNP